MKNCLIVACANCEKRRQVAYGPHEIPPLTEYIRCKCSDGQYVEHYFTGGRAYSDRQEERKGAVR